MEMHFCWKFAQDHEMGTHFAIRGREVEYNFEKQRNNQFFLFIFVFSTSNCKIKAEFVILRKFPMKSHLHFIFLEFKNVIHPIINSYNAKQTNKQFKKNKSQHISQHNFFSPCTIEAAAGVFSGARVLTGGGAMRDHQQREQKAQHHTIGGLKPRLTKPSWFPFV